MAAYKFPGGGSISYFRGEVDEVEITGGNNNAIWDLFYHFFSGTSVGDAGRVDVDTGGMWEVFIIGYAYTNGTDYDGYFLPQITSVDSVGGFWENTWSPWFEWRELGTGPRADFCVTGLLDVPSGGGITVWVSNFNADNCFTAYEIACHYVGPTAG